MSTTISSKFHLWADEVNKDWGSPYNAVAGEENLIVYSNGKEAARIEYNNGRYTVTGADSDAVEQLTYMVER